MPSLAEKRRQLRAKLQQPPPCEDDPHPNRSGVLLSDEIEFYTKYHNLICPFDRDNLKPAAYELTLGDEYFLNGEYHTLDPSNNVIHIPPFEVSVLKTAEIIRLSRYIIGRWNIKVSLAYSGLLWVGGPQVDPGWVGHLHCPIYNLSDKTVTLNFGDKIAVIDFVKTTPFDKTKSELELKRYPFPRRLIIQDYKIDDLRSALFTKAGQKLVEFEEEIQSMTARFATFTSLSFLIFTFVISALAIIPKGNADNLTLGTAVWGGLVFGISTFALLIALFSNVPRWVGPLVYELYGPIMSGKAETAMRFLRRRWWAGLLASLLLSGGVALGFYALVAPSFQNLRGQMVLTKADLESIVDRDINKLSKRLTQLEEDHAVTADGLHRMKTDLEQQIKSLRLNPK